MIASHTFEILLLLVTVALAEKIFVNSETTVECHHREYTFKATQTDETGRQCWDFVTAMSCWGRCDSGEIGDWRFPFKRSFHPVCTHDRREARYIILQNCDPEADLNTAEYIYYEALSCSCLLCDSSTSSCQGIPTYDEYPLKEIFSAQAIKSGRVMPTDPLH